MLLYHFVLTKLRIREIGKDYERPKEKKDGEDYWIPTNHPTTKRTTYRTTKRTTYRTTKRPNRDPYDFGIGKK